MNLWGPAFFTNDALIAEIQAYAITRREVANNQIRIIRGEGRWLEFSNTAESRALLDSDLREMLAEARRRGLPIGGTSPGALAVEIGIP